MASDIVDTAAKLQLDEATGEMVSKNELKKRLQKRARKAATQARKENEPPKATSDVSSSKPKNEDRLPLDPDAMFKQGFLADIYRARSSVDVLTRFPPEPNGYLHLGHAKAIAINFGFARFHGGKTILRFDDTNPDKEKDEYFVAIEEAVRWLGFAPHRVTYSSDNFERLSEHAERLIQKEKAYVCHCVKSQIQLQRGGKDGKEGPRFRCDHADQDVDTNLAKFRDMRNGKYEPQTAFLRMKQDIENDNPQMWDLAAYRIPRDKTAHVRTGEKWKIYPTYDFTHCLCDSFEGITHSLCTTEFILSRESYEWLNHTLQVYEPMQREYGRLNVSNTITSKRGLEKLVEMKIVRGWDDPRLYTLSGLRRRGVPPGAILSFINELGVTTARSVIQMVRFEQSIRRYLEVDVPRLMLVLDPIRVIIDNLKDLEGRDFESPFFAKRPEMGHRKLALSKTIYIDHSDFREVDDPDYYRLAPGKTVGLFQIPYPIRAASFTKGIDGRVEEVRAVLEPDGRKPKAFIQWVPEGSRNVQVRIHGRLFQSEDPSSVEGGFLNDIDPSSETIYDAALIENGFSEIRRTAPWPQPSSGAGVSGPEDVRFQALRVAYFAMDADSTDDNIVLNQIVPLKEDAAKS